MSGSTKVINSLKVSGLLEPPKTAGVPEASNWLILLSLMSFRDAVEDLNSIMFGYRSGSF